MATKVKLIETGAVTGNIIPDGGIATGKLANDAVTTIKISDANITHAKLHTSMDLTGKTVTVATAAGSTNTTAAASTAFVQQELTTLIGGAPSTLNDLNELAAAINDDANYNSTLTTALATKLPLAGGTMTGALTSNSLIKTTGDLEIASTQPRIMLDRSNGSYTWNIYNGDGSGNFPQSTFNIANNAGTAVITALDSGNVGIGTTAPGTKLHIAGANSSRNTIVSNLTLDGGTSASNPYDGFGFGINFIGRDYGNAIRNYAHIHSVIENQTSNSGGGDAGFKSLLSFYTNSGGASGTNPTEKMRITSAGDVGIGNIVPAQTLEIHNSNASDYTDFGLRGTGHKYVIGVGNASASTVNDKWYLYDNDNSAFRMVVDTSGNVGIGTTNPAQNFVVAAATNGQGIELVPGTLNYIQAYNRGTSDYGDLKIDGQTIQFGVDNGTEAARFTADRVLQINATKNYGSGSTYPSYTALGGHIHGYVNGSGTTYPRYLDIASIGQGDGSKGGEIRFLTSPNGTTTGVQRVRINQAGDVLIGSTTTNLDVLSGTPKIQVGNGTGHSSIQFYSNTDAVGALYFGDNTSGIQRYNGYIEYRHSGDTMAFRANGAQKLLLGNDVTTFNDPIETTTDTGTRMYTGLATGSHYQSTGYLILDTTIPDPGQGSGANMFSIHINGYSYDSTNGGIIDLNIGTYSGEGYFHNASYTGSNIPDKWVNNVRFARKSSTNTVSIILGDSGTSQPNEVAATLFIQGFGTTSASYAKGWDWKISTSTTGYTQLTKVNEKSTKRPSFSAASSGFSVASGWQIISDSMSQTHDGPDDDYNPSNGRFTPQLPGYYQFNFGGWATYSSSTGQERYAVAFAKNGSLTYLAGGNYSSADSPLAGASQRVYLNGSSDYVVLYAYSSVATQWGGSSHWVWWDGYWTGS